MSHRCLQEWRHLIPARTRQTMPAPVWEGIATPLNVLNHPHVAAFITIFLETYLRPSELLALRKKGLVPPLMPFLPCRSVTIAAFETGVATKARVREGSVLMAQRCLEWSTSSCTAQGWRSRRADLEFRQPCRSKKVQISNRFSRTQRRHHVPNKSQWSRKIRQKQSSGDRLPLSPHARSERSRKHSRNVPR